MHVYYEYWPSAMTAVSRRNQAILASNERILASNLGIFASNEPNLSSNEPVFASNKAILVSNKANLCPPALSLVTSRPADGSSHLSTGSRLNTDGSPQSNIGDHRAPAASNGDQGVDALALSLNSSADTSARLRVGRITGAHGLRGALRLRPDNPDSDTLEHVRRVFIEPPAEGSRRPRVPRESGASRESAAAQKLSPVQKVGANPKVGAGQAVGATVEFGAAEKLGTAQEFKLVRAERVNAAAIRLTLEGFDDPEAAEALRGAAVSVLISDLPPKAPGEFYYYEAIGCAVATTDGRLIGVIEDVIATGANDVWVVRDGATEVLVPVIENVVKSMDLGARRMVVEAVPGLLD